MHCVSICDYAHETGRRADLQCCECSYTQNRPSFPRLTFELCPGLQILDYHTLLL
jgi:hypothetical protein